MRWAVSLLLWVGLACVSFCGCATSSGGNLRGDVKTAQAPASLSAKQCAAGAEIERAGTEDLGYIIQPSDQLDLDFYLNSEFNDSVTVRPDGKITLRLIGDVQAGGLTPGQLAERLDKAYSNELQQPGAAVHVKNMPSHVVYVDGQVTKPGEIRLEAGMTALQAIADSGGLTPDAASEAVLIRRDACGSPTGSKIDLDAAQSHPDKGEDVALAPRDILLVPRSGIANLDLFVLHYIKNLMPVQPYLPL
jgi:polysaccharide biosynthesis/export protein